MKKENDLEILCPCGTGNTYKNCCKPFHQGQLPESALKLMRSRYSAYALNLPCYIISTTHPKNPQFCCDALQWSLEISKFSSHTQFKELKIIDSQENEAFATVTFIAYLFQNKKDASFTEKSHFEKLGDKWLYLNGKLLPPTLNT